MALKPRQNGNADVSVEQKAQALHDHYGSWEKASRRIGLHKDKLRVIVQNGQSPRDETRKKIDRGYFRADMEHLLGYDAVGTAIQALAALKDTDTSRRQEKIIQRGMEILQGKMDILSLGNIDRLRDEICDS